MLREAREEDLEDVIDMYWENYEEMFGVQRERLKEIDRKIWGRSYAFLSVENLKKGLNKKYKIVVFEEDGKILGFALYYENDEILLDEIHVKRGYRRRGIGRKMIDYLKRKGKKIIAYASESSLGFFMKNGFKEVGSFIGYLNVRWYKVIWSP